MKPFTRVILTMFLLSQLAMAQQGTRTIFLVRHAETPSAAPDAGLSPAGEKRAGCLAKMLKEAGIRQIFVSDARGTQQTAAPLAAALKLTPTVVPAKDSNTLIRDLLYSGGGNILVVGHNDTLPFVLARVKAGSVPSIGAKRIRPHVRYNDYRRRRHPGGYSALLQLRACYRCSDHGAIQPERKKRNNDEEEAMKGARRIVLYPIG